MRTPWRNAAVTLLLLLASCRTAGTFDNPMGMSAAGSENSSAGFDSNSGQSSNADSSKSDLNQSSAQSSGDSSKSNSGESKSGESSKDGTSKSHTGNGSGSALPSATTATGTSAGIGFLMWHVSQQAAVLPPAAAPAEVGKAAQVYLRARSHQLREDLALGAGPTLEDLAAAARIRRENLGTFGRLLRAHREELLTLADTRALTPERAVEWLRRVGQLALTDARLAEDHRAFVAWAEAGGMR